MSYHLIRDQMDPQHLSLELLKSIREIDCRIDELKKYLEFNKYQMNQEETRAYLLRRIEGLLEDRFCFVYSFLELNPVIKNERDLLSENTNPFKNLGITYEDLRRKA